jgi:hypothetical protein
VINDPPIRLFGHTKIETTITRLHMENWYFPTLGRNDGQAAVGVTQHKHCFRPDSLKDTVHADNKITNRIGGPTRVGRTIEKKIRLANAQIIKEDLIQLVVIVLASMHQDVVACLV